MVQALIGRSVLVRGRGGWARSLAWLIWGTFAGPLVNGSCTLGAVDVSAAPAQGGTASQSEALRGASAAAVAGVSRAADAGATHAPRAPSSPRELSWRFEAGPFGPTDVVISVPGSSDPAVRFPVLVAFHGRGESAKGSRRGARGWLDDYLLGRGSSRLERPPLNAADFEAYVSDARLEQINGALRERPYAGLIVVCPFLPDLLHGERTFVDGGALANFIVDTLLPRVYAKTPAFGTAASTGVDGASWGGRASLLVGFARPLAFGAVGSLQAALESREVARFADLGARALAQNPRLLLRLLTSDEDYFLNQNQELSTALGQRGVPHALTRVLGTHGVQFNRGPGVLEMLLFHSRVLRGEPPP